MISEVVMRCEKSINPASVVVVPVKGCCCILHGCGPGAFFEADVVLREETCKEKVIVYCM